MPPLNRPTRKLPHHILVVRTSAMGDVAMLPHVLRAFQAAYPDVRVTVATKPLFRPFFAELNVDFMEIDTRGRHKGVRGALRFARQARAAGIDAVADMHNVLRSKLIRAALWLSGFPTRAIDKGRREKRRRIHGRGGALKHTVARYGDVLRRMGFVFDDPAPALRGERHNPMGEKNGTWIGFAPFSAHRGKTYPAAQAAGVVRLLSEKYDRVFIHGGGGSEADFALSCEARYPNVTALHGKLKLSDELDLLAHLDLVVTMDSLVAHMAALIGTPVVSIWGATHPDLGFQGYGASSSGVLQLDLPCRPCSVYGKTPCKYGDYHCLSSITPAMVVRKVEEVIAAKNKPRE